jgi:hypothetical protein
MTCEAGIIKNMFAFRFIRVLILTLALLSGVAGALAEPFKVGISLPLSGANAGFGTEDNLSFAANTYELALFLDELFKDVPHGSSSTQVLGHLAAVKTHSGTVTGPYTYVSDPQQGQLFRFEIGLRRIKGLDWESVK